MVARRTGAGDGRTRGNGRRWNSGSARSPRRIATRPLCPGDPDGVPPSYRRSAVTGGRYPATTHHWSLDPCQGGGSPGRARSVRVELLYPCQAFRCRGSLRRVLGTRGAPVSRLHGPVLVVRSRWSLGGSETRGTSGSSHSGAVWTRGDRTRRPARTAREPACRADRREERRFAGAATSRPFFSWGLRRPAAPRGRPPDCARSRSANLLRPCATARPPGPGRPSLRRPLPPRRSGSCRFAPAGPRTAAS